MFCPKCGSLLMPKTIGAKKVIACSCGYKSQDTKSLAVSEKKVVKDRDVEVVHDKGDADSLPLTKEECPKCHHGMAYYWLTQTRAGDEPETRFFRCQKCKHTWREYA
ncbi:MAG TPA: transcription factor S [Candidatus Nanoarchaeia archaeon]|nr:transcription factor S [Candidatus Nanoarchaeia archaeon]